jgi:alpha-tubulin suppressor-like RCC1 family protein/putative cell wall-binding protein
MRRRTGELARHLIAVSALLVSALGVGIASGSPSSTAASDLSAVTQVSVGRGFACAVTSADHVYCWGNNATGQLGNGTTTKRASPVEVEGVGGPGDLSTVTHVSAGSNDACAVTSADHVYCWGGGATGQLGDGTTAALQATPVEVEGVGGAGDLSTVTHVSVGSSEACAVTSAGHVFCWGAGSGGQLGNGTTTTRQASPVEVAGVGGSGDLSTVTQVSAGLAVACAVTSSGNVDCWGANTFGGLGIGSTKPIREDTPVEVEGVGGTGDLSTVTQVSAGAWVTCAGTSTDHVYCWGTMPVANTSNERTPVEIVGVGGIGDLSTVAQISAGALDACAAATTHHAFCWGANTTGDLGDGTTTVARTPVEVEGVGGTGSLSTVTQVSAGWSSTCATTATGHAYCWGANATGQLGDGTTTNARTPVAVEGIATTPTVTVTPNPLLLTYGTETRATFTVTVTGTPGHGYPEGTISLKVGGAIEAVTCTGSTTHATTDTSVFTCRLDTVNEIQSGTDHDVTASYTPAAPSSPNPGYSYNAATAWVTFDVASPPQLTRIFGATADATASAELAHQFTPTAGACPPSGSVVLARDDYYSDALASQYLAASLTTGTLLTPTSRLSPATETALRDEGITHVYIVGGPLAVSTAVAAAIGSLPVYDCGGKTESGGVIQVTRITGATEYATARAVSAFVAADFVGHADISGAYAGTNAEGGDGAFNDTAGNGSSSPAAAGTLATAIVATGATFQDAESASAISYVEHFPVLLTTPTALSPQAATAIRELAIKQVIVMGGQVAVSDAVASELEELGVSVLRVAGVDDTDTAVETADFEMSDVGLHWAPVDRVVVARGTFFSDGLAGAVVEAGAGRSNAHDPEPLLLSDSPTTAGQYLTSFFEAVGLCTQGISDDGLPVTSLTVLGGPLAVTTTMVDTMREDLGEFQRC